MVIGVKMPEDDLGEIDTCRNFDGFCAKIYIVSAYSAFICITQWTDYECKGMNSTTLFSVMCRVIMVGGRDSVVVVTTHYVEVRVLELR